MAQMTIGSSETPISLTVIGAGGLAHPLLLELLRLWPQGTLAKIWVIDQDKIEISNLHRQVAFTENDLGNEKSQTLVDKLREEYLSKNVELCSRSVRLNDENSDELLRGSHLVFDCCDHIPTKFLINDYCVGNSIPFCYAGAVEERGMCLAVPAGLEKPCCLRCIFGKDAEELLRQQTETCQTSGILGPVVGLVGTLQAQLGLRLLGLLGDTPSRESLFFRFSGKTLQWTETIVGPAADCSLVVQRSSQRKLALTQEESEVHQ